MPYNDKEYSVVYGAGTIKFSEDGEVLFNEDQNSSFSEINYNSNLKYLSFSQLIENSDSAFENFNLIVKTELLRRSLNFLCYIVIFLVGLEILLSFAKTLNVNRILVYGFGACLIYGFVESVFADSISVFMLPYYLQAFPVLLILLYYTFRKRLFF